MGPSWLQIAIVVALVLLFFGRGKISGFMGDMAEGIKSFRKGLLDNEAPDQTKPKAVKSVKKSKKAPRKTHKKS